MEISQYSRIMGIDFGDKRIGIAFSDLMRMIATAYETMESHSREHDLEYLSKLAMEKQVSSIVVGLPLNMDGSEGERASITKEFGSQLAEKTKLPVIYVDERLTSVEASALLHEANIKAKDQKKYLDKLSAQIILQSYLDYGN